MAIKTYTGPQNGNYLTASNWSTGTAPAAYDLLIDNYYNIDISNTTINHEIIDLDQTGFNNPSGSIAGLTFNNVTIGKDMLIISQRTVGFGLFTLDDSTLRGTFLNTQGGTQISVDTSKYAVNYGLIASVGTTPNQSSLGILAHGNFSNNGIMEAYGIGDNVYVTAGYGSPTQFQNNGLIEADSGASVGIDENVVSQGQIRADGGTLAVYANITQKGHGAITLTNNATMFLQGSSDGGVINIESGMLDFSPMQFKPGYMSAGAFRSAVDFTGQTGSIGFGVDITESFRAVTNDIQIVSTGSRPTVLADIQLHGAYTAADFSVVGQSIVYAANHRVGLLSDKL